ncbi:hypothetical protein GQ55_7G135200 [Panicum hallii var. hallii]|uniref:Uncharacterized protein n=1 Tax=Panicum hallii var. hallii TaxID=1504633 RepID=A0A2T7CV13_9POAL|nr:hypothetical protein GQ55_7G135200 [Panicum hallii var. hallii]
MVGVRSMIGVRWSVGSSLMITQQTTSPRPAPPPPRPPRLRPPRSLPWCRSPRRSRAGLLLPGRSPGGPGPAASSRALEARRSVPVMDLSAGEAPMTRRQKRKASVQAKRKVKEAQAGGNSAEEARELKMGSIRLARLHAVKQTQSEVPRTRVGALRQA